MAFSFRVGTNWCHDFPKLARESGFYFNMHSSRVRVDWNRISNIDIERVIRERDFYTVDENVNNVIDYCLEREYDVKILDPNFVKLFRLAQLAVEYLLYCKQYLDHSVVILKDELRLKIEENVKLKKELSASEEMIKSLKEKSKDKGKFIEARIGDCNGQIHKCPHCPKTFVSAMFVSAHMARRHSYISDQYSTSPIHEHYRAETEKLHSEIKSLKERLNQTERVIRNESERISDKSKTDYERRLSENDVGLKYDSSRIEDQYYRKGYQEEINSLKNMLFDEIRNLRLKERSMHENASESNVQTLINQQEKEFQKLRNQLLEKLTPDIESMQVKIHAQENFWKSKIELLESQHRMDMEKLIAELKFTQKAADEIKAKYESKVNDLERQTINQSNILFEQSKQLHSLSRGINSARNEPFKTSENVTPEAPNQRTPIEQRKVTDYQGSREKNPEINDRSISGNNQIVIEDINSISSLESTVNSKPSSQKKPPQNNVQVSTVENKKVKYKEGKTVKVARPRKNSSRTPEDLNVLEKYSKTFEHSDVSDSQDEPPKAHINHQAKGITDKLHDRVSINDSYFDKFRTRDFKTIFENGTVRKFSTNGTNERNKIMDTFEDDLTSGTNSDDVTSASLSESESESLATIKNGSSARQTSAVSAQKHKKTNYSTNYKQSREDLQEAFEKKLRDLGIDPEWQGIPKGTFKQKMDILKHHQAIATKKFSKYKQIKSKLIEEFLNRISKKERSVEASKHTKKSRLSKLVTNVKSTAAKAFIAQKIPEKRISVAEVENATPTKISPAENIDEDESFEVTKDSSHLTRAGNKEITYNYFESMTTQSTELLDFNNKKNEVPMKLSDDEDMEDKNLFEESLKRVLESEETSGNNSRDPFNKSNPSHNSEIVMVSSILKEKEAFVSKSTENGKGNDLKVQKISIHDFLASPKYNKSVLKSTTGSTASLVKKKVLFDLKNDKNEGSLFEYDATKADLNDSDWNASSLSDDKDNLLEKEKPKETTNIILKTTQSEKIAEISRKIEEQLSIARQQPVGSVETMFAPKYVEGRKNHNNEEQQVSSTSISSIFDSPLRTSAFSSMKTKNSFPRPAPRNVREMLPESVRTQSEFSDLDSDIEDILKVT